MEKKIENHMSAFAEEFKRPSTLEETKIKNLLGYSKDFIELDQYRKKHPEEQKLILQKIAGYLADMDIYKGCCSAFFCGVMIGEEVGKEGIHIVDLFVRLIDPVCHVLDFTDDDYPEEEDLDELFDSDPNAVRAFRGMSPLMMALMDVLAKSPESRDYLRRQDREEEIERIAPFIKNGNYLLRIYPVCKPMDIVVLSPEKKQGIIVQACDLGTNFHLMTLLERALLKSGQASAFGLSSDVGDTENLKLFAYSAGEEDAHENYSVTAHASYFSYDKTMLWGEMPPESIPCFHGMPVVLVYPEQAARSWDLFFAVRCHPYLCPTVEIKQMLTLKEVEEWIENLSL